MTDTEVREEFESNLVSLEEMDAQKLMARPNYAAKQRFITACCHALGHGDALRGLRDRILHACIRLNQGAFTWHRAEKILVIALFGEDLGVLVQQLRQNKIVVDIIKDTLYINGY